MKAASLAEFSSLAATRYLQSAVFIDDNIYNQGGFNPDAVGAIAEPRQPKAVMLPDDAEANAQVPSQPALTSTGNGALPAFRTKDLVGSFAEFGIVCALYEPEQGFSTDEQSTVFKLCQTADLVILDWDFHEVGVEGTKPKALIENLIQTGNRTAPHHVRLIAIYTNTQSLHSIANSILQHLDSKKIKAEPVAGCAFRLQSGSSRVIVLGKPGTKRVDDEQPFTVLEKDLPRFLIEEFALMNRGILPSCALLGMAAVRQNSRRILDKFPSTLDANFLLHRAMVRSSEEAFDQLPELLGDEFRAVVEDCDFKPDDVAQFIKNTSSDIAVKKHANPWKVAGSDSDAALKHFWSEDNGLAKLLNGGKAAAEDGPQPKKPAESLAIMCSVSDKDAYGRFAAVLAGRTQYQAKHRDLVFGSIVMNTTSKEFSVCIIPICDSLRLKKATSFPFWRLKSGGRGYPVIVQREDATLQSLTFEAGKPSSLLWMASFTPDPTRGIVTALKNEAAKYIFKAGDAEFEWIAQLKPSHAQRIANSIGQQLSRVGLTEAEWARITFRDHDEA